MVGYHMGSISFENSDIYNSPYNFPLAATIDAPFDPNGKQISVTATRIKDPAAGMKFNAPEAALPAGWVSYQISLQAPAGDLIDSVSVDIDGPLHQRWTYWEEAEPSPTGAASDGRGDTHLTPPPGSTWSVYPTEFNSRWGSPLTSTPYALEYGLGNVYGAWTLPVPTAATNVAYIVFPENERDQLQITIRSKDTQGNSFRTLTLADIFVPEPSSSFLILVALMASSVSGRCQREDDV
jgi:hypothetical protein